MIPTLPFAHLNLRWNPFGEPARAERGALAVADLPELRAGDPVQLIGPAGRGKTTHLLALAARHRGAVYEHVPEGADRFVSEVTDGAVFLLDEAQRVRPALIRGLLARRLTLALATHEDLSSTAGRTLRTTTVGKVEPARLEEILRRRIEWARRGPGPLPRVAGDGVRRLIDRFGDDVRAMEGWLYDVFQRLKEPGDVQV